jgi:hypothetical protein
MELIQGEIYIDKTTGEVVEFNYLSTPGSAVVLTHPSYHRELQTSYATNPANLIPPHDYYKRIKRLEDDNAKLRHDLHAIYVYVEFHRCLKCDAPVFPGHTCLKCDKDT